MKAKLICDGCDEELKDIMDDDDMVYIVNDNINGLSMMEHNNLKNHVVLCEECHDRIREDLEDNEDWMDLEMLDNTPGMVEDFDVYDRLVERIKGVKK